MTEPLTISSPRLSPEQAVLVAAAMPSTSSASARLGSDIGIRLSWPTLLNLAEHHRLCPLLSRWLQHGKGLGAPDEVAAELKRQRLTTGARNVMLQAELGAISEALANENVPCMALKGAALVDRVYDDVSLRPMLDLDILVRPAHIRRAEALLHSMGYTTGPGRSPEAVERVRQGDKYAFPLLVKERPVIAVDLHRNLGTDLAGVDVGGFWERGRADSSQRWLRPSDDDLLLHAGLHFFKDRLRHSTAALGQLADMAWIVDRCLLDWDGLVDRARGAEVGGRLAIALASAEALLGVPVPAGVISQLAPRRLDSRSARRFMTRRVLGTATWHPPAYFVCKSPSGFGATRRPLQRLFPSRAYLVNHHGSMGSPTSYPRLLWRRTAAAVLKVRPWQLPEDLFLGRWMASVGRPRGGAPSQPRAAGADDG